MRPAIISMNTTIFFLAGEFFVLEYTDGPIFSAESL